MVWFPRNNGSEVQRTAVLPISKIARRGTKPPPPLPAFTNIIISPLIPRERVFARSPYCSFRFASHIIMGCLFSSGRRCLTTAVSVEIAAPSEIVWETIADLDANVETLSVVKSFDRISGEKFAVGTKWREERNYSGGKKSLEQIRTISNITHDPRSFSVNIGYPDSKNKLEDIANTSTLTVQPIDDTRCALVVSLAFMSGAGMWEVLCRDCLMRYVERAVTEELEDYARAALKREEAKRGNRGTH